MICTVHRRAEIDDNTEAVKLAVTFAPRIRTLVFLVESGGDGRGLALGFLLMANVGVLDGQIVFGYAHPVKPRCSLRRNEYA